MIQSVLLVTLGFLTAGFATLLFASAFWKRAIRLTTERIHNSMPATLAEIEADKDQLRADFAIRIRQLEAELEKSERRTAKQKIEISRKEIELVQLRNEFEHTGRNLDEQKNANQIYEQTIITRLPKMEAQLAKAKELLGDRYQEISKLRTTINQQESKIGQATAKEQLRQAELDRLKSTGNSSSRIVGKSSSDTIPLTEFELLKKQNEHLENRVASLLKRLKQKSPTEGINNSSKEEHLESIELSLLDHAAATVNNNRRKQRDLKQSNNAIDNAVITIDKLISEDTIDITTAESDIKRTVAKKTDSTLVSEVIEHSDIKKGGKSEKKTKRRSIRETLTDRLKGLQGSS